MIKLKSVITRNVWATVLHKINKGKYLVYLRDPPLRMLMHAVDRSRSWHLQHLLDHHRHAQSQLWGAPRNRWKQCPCFQSWYLKTAKGEIPPSQKTVVNLDTLWLFFLPMDFLNDSSSLDANSSTAPSRLVAREYNQTHDCVGLHLNPFKKTIKSIYLFSLFSSLLMNFSDPPPDIHHESLRQIDPCWQLWSFLLCEYLG